MRQKSRNHIYKITLIFLLPSFFLSCAAQKLLERPSAKVKTSESTVPDRRALDHFLRALDFEENRFYQGALLEYRRALQFDQNSVELRLGITRNYFILNMSDSAAVEARRILDLQPDNVQALALLGQIYFDQQAWESALNIYQQLILKYPKEMTFHAKIAAIYLQQNLPQKALAEYYIIADSSDNPKDILERAAGILTLNKFYPQAFEIYFKLLAENPGDDYLYYNLGTVHFRAENLDSALYYFNSALSINPTQAQYYLSKGFLLNRKNSLSEAEETLKAGISATPQEPSLYDLLGTVLQREKKYAEALETLYKSIALDSTSTTPYVTIGFIYDDLDSTEKAISTYETALRIDSSDALVMNNYAYLLAEANIRLEEAKKMSAKSLEAEPENPSYLDTMGWIYYRLKDYSEAEKYLVKALKLANNPIMYLHLGDVLRDAGQITRAQEIYRKGLEIAPDDYELKQRVENK